MNKEKIRNIAVIAHVDHGKTTLLNGLLKECNVFKQYQEVQDRVMDSDSQEKERGITILSKNTSVNYNGYKINIVDTPGHSDFGGEVERVLKMVDGVILLVDSVEGTMPQTRIVLKKALELDLVPIVVINKIDRKEANVDKAFDSTLDLFIDLGANEDQLEFPLVYASAKEGYAKLNMDDENVDLKPLLDSIIKYIPAPSVEDEGPFQMLVSNIDYDDYVGRIAVGRIERGVAKLNMPVSVIKQDDSVTKGKIGKIYTFEGLKKESVTEAHAGDIVSLSGMENINIGETICDESKLEKIDFVNIDEPTISMTFGVNDGPLAGREGKLLTSRQIKDRLEKETLRNISLKLEEMEQKDRFKVSGRGELHITVLIENMRREGFELLISKPSVIIKDIDGVKSEPVEILTIDVPSEYTGTVMEKLGKRKALLEEMIPENTGRTNLTFRIPSRGLIGYRAEFMTDTRGLGIMNHVFDSYEPYKGEIHSRTRGSIVAFEAGKSVAYGLYNAQDKGELFIGPGVEVYEGMVVGINSRQEDLEINVCKEKHLSNMRSSGADEALTLTPPIQLTLEKAIEFIDDDELVEVTPENIRIRKSILNSKDRKRQARK